MRRKSVPDADAASSPPAGLGGLVATYLDEQYAALVDGDTALRSGDLSSVHATRVASRRYRSVLTEFEPLFDDSEVIVLEESLRWWGRVLGRVRDVQIAADELAGALDRLPAHLDLGDAARVVAEELARREEEARAGLARALDRGRYATMMRRLTAWHDAPAVGGSHVPEGDVSRHLKRSLKRYRKRLDEAKAAGDPDELVHEARKAAKRARYVAELARPTMGKKAKNVARQMTGVQDRLGTRQDRGVVRDLLLEVVHRSEAEEVVLDGPTGFTLGLLYATYAEPDDLVRQPATD